jgi:hypothetical protein
MYYATPDLVDKFTEMSGPLLSRDRQDEVVRLVLNDFDRLPDIDRLLRLLDSEGTSSRSGTTPTQEGSSHA